MIGAYTWFDSAAEFGGLSGIEVSADGNSFVAVGDRALLVRGQFQRENGVLIGIENVMMSPLRDQDGGTLPPDMRDSEGIAIRPNGEMMVSFEAVHGLRMIGPDGMVTSPLLTDRSFANFQSNSSFEALAVDAAGSYYVLPERSGRANRPFPIFRYANGAWDQPFEIPRRTAFLVVGADIGPDNRFYVLERDFTGIGFRTRVRRFDLDGSNEETLIETGVGFHDNLEGISVWRNEGGLRLTMVSDDNFRFLQRTEVVEYQLTD